MAPGKGKSDDVFGTLVTTAAKILAPNSLQFDDNEFERSPAEAKQAATEAAKLVQPGDLIFITTKGFIYSMSRFLTNNEYDHMVIVLNDRQVLHVGPPSVRLIQLERLLLPQRQPVVLRPDMTEEERQRFIRCAYQLDGSKYDVVRLYQLMLRISLKKNLRSTPLGRLPLDVRNHAWVCTDAAMVLLAGCSDRFRQTLTRAKEELELDIITHGSASFNDFTRLRQLEPTLMPRINLPVLTYTSNPHKRPLRAYVGEFLELITRIQSGKVRWHLFEQSVLPKIRPIVEHMGPKTMSSDAKIQLLAYVLVLLVFLKRGATVKRVFIRASQLLLLRYVIQQLLMHVKLQDLTTSMLAKM
ncbi:hypothetical protein Poli38472_003068 [Pythium oligandrum]|uniref:Uncharacterized protein n=1 Tax=Pythium oligandrum TaxID=41045 RepID=A0A8K1C6F6_PYTOL|nr:hypothetical protein Poli38472_003068 [Pythium oligandrum]|eukprot:TMW57143.1 hypothetical protein Poli38472_003068 [Pythium oligandrum]